MNIVGPLLLLGGAIFIVSKRCELLGLCGETGGDVTPEAAAEETPTEETVSPVSDTSPSGNAKKSGCCTCQMQGDRVKCHRGDAQWFNPPAGSGGSNDQSVELSLEECNKGCGGSSINKGQGSTTGAGARASGSASIPKKPRLSASGSVGSGAGAGGTRRTSSSSKPRSSGSGSSLGGGARVNAGASFYAYYPRRMRSYFVDPYYVRPFNLCHRIAN
jgi:hypothetical protein